MLQALLQMQAQAQQLKAVPPLRARVNDEVGMLAPDQRARLENVLADYEKRTGSQIAVLLVASTEPEAIEQYSIRVTDAWQLGRKGVDDGVLLLVARDNPKALRRLRIEAGRGVQGVLTDAQSKRILQDTIAPHFRQNDYYGGLVAGVGAISALLDKEKFPAPAPQAQAGAQAADDDGAGIGFGVVMIVLGIVFIASLFRRRRHPAVYQPDPRHGRPDWGAGATGFILGNILANAQAEEERRRRGGFDGGFGGGDSSGGFSGGGGSFDGGGASGDW
nr:TPM domain-containing protein [Massilia sp. 9096]